MSYLHRNLQKKTVYVQGRFLDKIAKPFNTELPEFETLDAALEDLLPQVQRYSEDLREQEFFIEKHWIEKRDDETFQQTRLYIFRDSGDCIVSTDSQVDFGQWEILGDSNKMIINGSTLYTLSFLDEEYFVLRKHGNVPPFQDRYLLLVNEPLSRMEWNEILESLFNKYRNSNSFFFLLAFIILAIIMLLLLMV